MAKKLDIDSQRMLDDFNTTAPTPIDNPQDENGNPIKRRRRRKREIVRVSAYLSPAQYKMLDEMARDDNETLTQTIGHAIEELWDKRQRQLTARLASAKRSQ